ncbi:hypothetical protein KTAU_08250 [Thermogemmatispora aurantia]|uniref:Uncharacterized protein n=1 Tax=Thermogemmatispora aurantia TaxID=2045279 RepID=A0A5J4K6A3_9CHLR|nr:hypothetical protein KTAU_08250 [Thermogemmatispora aurantia]
MGAAGSRALEDCSIALLTSCVALRHPGVQKLTLRLLNSEQARQLQCQPPVTADAEAA